MLQISSQIQFVKSYISLQKVQLISLLILVMVQKLTVGIVLTLVIALCQIDSGFSLPTPIVPNKFTQFYNYSFTYRQFNTNGQLWFDNDVLSYRIDYANSTQYCTQLMGFSNVSCTILAINTTMWMFNNDKALCCSTKSYQTVGKDVFYKVGLEYQTTKKIDNVNYNWFVRKTGALTADADLLLDMTKQIPRRFQLRQSGNNATFDYWPNTYSENFNSTTVFAIPSFCKNPCKQQEDYNENEAMNKNLIFER